MLSVAFFALGRAGVVKLVMHLSGCGVGLILAEGDGKLGH